MEKISVPALSNISELTRRGHARIGLSAAPVNANAEPAMYIDFGGILLLARTVLAVAMIYYGWPKIRDLQATAHEFAQMGFHPPVFWGTLIALVEFVGGMAMLLGFFPSLRRAYSGSRCWSVLSGNSESQSLSLTILMIFSFLLWLVIMSQGAGILVPARFDASIFLRWDVAAAALASALLFAALCKPKLAGQERYRLLNSEGERKLSMEKQ